MKYTLRDYQLDCSNESLRLADPKKPLLNIVPTGGGKSLIQADIGYKSQGNVIITQPNAEILKQNFEKYTSYGNDAAIYSASLNSKNINRVTFATIGSIKGKSELFQDVSTIIIDECDLVNPKAGMYKDFLEEMTQASVIGFTATPFRNKAYQRYVGGEYLNWTQANFLTRTRPRFFKTVGHVSQIKDLYDRGFLSPLDYEDWSDDIYWDLNSNKSDFLKESIVDNYTANNLQSRTQDAIKYLLSIGRKKILVFDPDIAASELTGKSLNMPFLHSKMKRRVREDVIRRFKVGVNKVLPNVMILTVGFDDPDIDGIVVVRPTLSLRLYMQMLGRGTRIGMKENCKVVDLVGNLRRFGKIEDYTFENDRYNKGWSLFCKDRLMTGVPLNDIHINKPLLKSVHKDRVIDKKIKTNKITFKDLQKIGFN